MPLSTMKIRQACAESDSVDYTGAPSNNKTVWSQERIEEIGSPNRFTQGRLRRLCGKKLFTQFSPAVLNITFTEAIYIEVTK